MDECPKQLPAIAQRLIGHFLPLFLDPAGPSISLADSMEEIDLRAFFKENFEALSTERKFQVLGHNFTLNGFRLHGALADHHGLVYAADFRAVLSEAPIAPFDVGHARGDRRIVLRSLCVLWLGWPYAAHRFPKRILRSVRTRVHRQLCKCRPTQDIGHFRRTGSAQTRLDPRSHRSSV